MLRRATFLMVVGSFCLALFSTTWAEEKAAGPGRRGPEGRGFGGPTMGGMGGMNKLMLLGAEKVQTELKITDEQKTKIQELQRAQGEKMRELFAGRGTRDMSQEERAKRMEELQKKRTELTAEADKAIAGILNADQGTRLQEIWVQQRGVEAFKDAAVAKDLKLTTDQVQKIDAVIASGQAEERKLLEEMRGQGGQGNQPRDPSAFQAVREKRQKIQKDTQAKALEVLTADQKAVYTKLQGKTFEVDPRDLFQGRGGPGGPGGRRGGGEGGGRPPEGKEKSS